MIWNCVRFVMFYILAMMYLYSLCFVTCYVFYEITAATYHFPWTSWETFVTNERIRLSALCDINIIHERKWLPML